MMKRERRIAEEMSLSEGGPDLVPGGEKRI